MAKYIYGVYQDGVEVFRGTAQEVANKYNYERYNVPGFIKRKKPDVYGNTYKIVEEIRGKQPKPPKKTKAEIKKELHEMRLNNIIDHLRWYGNTGTINPDEFIPELNKRGIFVDVKAYKHDNDNEINYVLTLRRQHD